jgi:hypothetical protein
VKVVGLLAILAEGAMTVQVVMAKLAWMDSARTAGVVVVVAAMAVGVVRRSVVAA